MSRAKSFFYVCLGVLALGIAFHLGAQSAQGQVPGSTLVAASAVQGGPFFAFASNGEVYYLANSPGDWRLGGPYSGRQHGANPAPGG